MSTRLFEGVDEQLNIAQLVIQGGRIRVQRTTTKLSVVTSDVLNGDHCAGK